MLSRMSPRLFDEWQAFSQVEPFGEQWVQTGMLCSVVANVMGSKKGGGTFKVQDFLPQPPAKKLDAKAEQQAMLRAWEQYAKRTSAAQGLGAGLLAPQPVKPQRAVEQQTGA